MTQEQKIAVIYHSIFNYSLSKRERIRWIAGPKLKLKSDTYLKKQLLKKRTNNEYKLQIAKRAAHLLAKLPTVLFVGITGSLAMNNAKPESDIDLMIITRKNSLWITRPFVYFLLKKNKFELRKPKDANEKDQVCLNFWIDETELSWLGLRNAYIAHEIAQVVPLVDKNEAYSRWLFSNNWVRLYWPFAVKYKSSLLLRSKKVNQKGKSLKNISFLDLVFIVANVLCFLVQRTYMLPKKSRETVAFSHAFFHPYDWGEKVTKELEKSGVVEV